MLRVVVPWTLVPSLLRALNLEVLEVNLLPSLGSLLVPMEPIPIPMAVPRFLRLLVLSAFLKAALLLVDRLLRVLLRLLSTAPELSLQSMFLRELMALLLTLVARLTPVKLFPVVGWLMLIRALKCRCRALRCPLMLLLPILGPETVTLRLLTLGSLTLG